MSSSTPPGWYDDGHGALRWWDGARWTEHTHVTESPTTPVTDPESASESASEPDPADVHEPADTYDAHEPARPHDGHIASEPVAPGVPPVPPLPALSGADAAADPSVGDAPAPPAAAPSAKRSKLWILFVALGAVLIGLIVLAAVFIPRIVNQLLDASGDGPAPAIDVADERAAADLVEGYDDAWDDIDCAAYQATLTPEFLSSYGFTDCAEFTVAAQQFNDSVDDYEVEVVSTSREGDVIFVETVESFTQVLDENGAPLETPVPGSFAYEYTLVPGGSGWLIDDFVEQP